MAQRPANFPGNDMNTVFSFFQHVKDRFASDPAIYHNFLHVLLGFRKGNTADPSEVLAQAYALLRGHPDLVLRLDAFFPKPAREDPAPTRPKRERRRPTPTAIDDDTRGALRYLERVRHTRPELYDTLLTFIFLLRSEETVADGNQIYERARELFGSADDDLLLGFAQYLPVPTGRDRDRLLRRRAPEEHHAPPAPKREAVAADNPRGAKRPRADDRRTTNRRARSPADESGAASPFRPKLEFAATYSKLVGTIIRTEELLKEYEPNAPAPSRGRRRSFEELFPSRESREVLREMYHDDNMLKPIREALEDGGARTEVALRTVQRRLGMLERVAVKMFMEKRDRARVEGRMRKLAVDRVHLLREEQAKKSARA